MNRFFNETLLIDFLSITLFILLAVILYRLILRYMSRKHVKLAEYCTLFDVEDQPISGVIPFYFTTERDRHVKFLIETEQGNLVATVADQPFETGGHLLRFDSSILSNGTYFYILQTENQEIRKKLTIKN